MEKTGNKGTQGKNLIRLGLCCVFRDVDIKFNTTTATHILKMNRKDALNKISNLCLSNSISLMNALKYCFESGIGCFRINSHILPVKTHPEAGYEIQDLPNYKSIVENFQKCGDFAKSNNIRTCFHPDQFVVLNSPNLDVVNKSILEIEYQTEVAEWVNADVVNIHGGGGYGDKKKAIDCFKKNFQKLSSTAKKLLTVENDDKVYTPTDLLPLCNELNIPLVYDVHHHRCLSDGFDIEQITNQSILTWNNREPLFHISSPKNGWGQKKEKEHHDFIDVQDFPDFWKNQSLTIEVEAKAKESAVLQLLSQIS